MRPFLLLALLLLPAAAADDDTEMLRIRRLAMEAQIRIGDVLKRKGDLDGARAAYEEALRLEQGPGHPAVRRALQWLAAHQDPDGKWDCDDFMKHDPMDDKCDGAGAALYDVGVTGLAALAFLRAGEATPGVRKALDYLVATQADDGVFGTRATHGFMYNHAIATLALCEGYRMTREARYRKPAQDALNFIAMARNPYLAWRYQPRSGENDTSVTGWCVMALRSGKQAGLNVDQDAFEGARMWIDKMTEPNFGRVGYNYPGGVVARPEGKQDRFPPDRSEAMTAVGIALRVELGEEPRSEAVRKGVELCLALPPVWNPDDGSIDMYYWFHGTEAMARIGGDPWRKWRGSLDEALLGSQHRNGARAGSWDPIGPWGEDGGRVYSTALMALALTAGPR